MKLTEEYYITNPGGYRKDGKSYKFGICKGCSSEFVFRNTKPQVYCSSDCYNKNFIPDPNSLKNLTDRLKSHTLPKGEAAFNFLFNKSKKNASLRGYSFNLEKEKFRELSKRNCFYCGCAPFQIYKSGKYNGNFIYKGLDRVNNDIGYLIDNVVPCCGDCNVAKRKMSLSKFINWIERVHLNIPKIKEWE